MSSAAFLYFFTNFSLHIFYHSYTIKSIHYASFDLVYKNSAEEHSRGIFLHIILVFKLQALAGVLPDTHFFSFLNEFIPEIRMSYIYQKLRPLPCGLTLQVCRTVFCDDKVSSHSRRCDYGSRRQYRRNTGSSLLATPCS